MRRLISALAVIALTGTAVLAADLPSRRPPPAPPPVGDMVPPPRAIWGAIAYSTVAGVDGIYWGGATRAEAEDFALKHCEDAERGQKPGAATGCRVATTFYNGWVHSTPAQPWPHCAALAKDQSHWSSASGLDQAGANDKALHLCGTAQCTVVREVCT